MPVFMGAEMELEAVEGVDGVDGEDLREVERPEPVMPEARFLSTR